MACLKFESFSNHVSSLQSGITYPLDCLLIVLGFFIPLALDELAASYGDHTHGMHSVPGVGGKLDEVHLLSTA